MVSSGSVEIMYMQDLPQKQRTTLERTLKLCALTVALTMAMTFSTLTSNFKAIIIVIILLCRSPFYYFAQVWSPHNVRQSITGLTSTLVAATPEAPTVQRLTFCSFFFATRRIDEMIWPLIALALRTLIYI